MKTMVVRIVTLLCLCGGLASALGQKQNVDEPLSFARVDVSKLPVEVVTSLKKVKNLTWWIELGEEFLILGPKATIKVLDQSLPLTILDLTPRPERVFALPLDHFKNLDGFPVHELARGGRFAIVQAYGQIPQKMVHQKHVHTINPMPVTDSISLAQCAILPKKGGPGTDPVIQSMVDTVDGVRWHNDVEMLACFNRYTHGNGVDDARDWLVQQFNNIPGLQVSTEAFSFSGNDAHNVMAVLPGTVTPDTLFIIGAHYDSISEDPNNSAPGAEDNASGAAAVLEMARIFAANPPRSTIIFMCYSGEEQGLHGSRDHVTDLISAGQATSVNSVLIMDMIGYTGDSDLDCLLETNESARYMVNTFSEMAGLYTNLRIETSFSPFGSDHMPYLNNNIPALLTIENDYTTYPGYHRTTDLIANVDLNMGRETIKMNIAGMATLIGVGIGTDPLPYITAWNKAAQPPVTFDLSGNMRIDVTEIARFYQP